MTTNDPIVQTADAIVEAAGEPIVFDEFLASVFAAQARQSAAIHNRVIENAEAEAAEWKRRFAEFYQDVVTANKRIDSATLQGVLFDAHPYFMSAIREPGEF